MVFENVSLSSDVCEAAGSDADIIIGFGFLVEDGIPKMIVSTRSHTGFNCGAFCRRFGGGGHTAAAGFSVAFQPWTGFLNPYSVVEAFVRRHEEEAEQG
jgi:nanoRNase/pAp phosphatase (c-di-AMP/oligoRNAs hydrolase)